MDRNNIIQEHYFKNTKELFIELSPFGEFSHILNGYIFRGESSDKFNLIPSALRLNNTDKLYSLSGLSINSHDESEFWQQLAELQSLKKFYTLADERGITIPDIPSFRDDILNPHPLGIYFPNYYTSGKWVPDELLELAALAQHYGVPTRFIDWSLNINTSLYFASVGCMRKESSDFMVLWALNYSEIERRKKTVEKIPLRLIKPAYQRNPNLLAQKGVLTCWEYDNQLITLSKIIEDKVPNLTPINRTPLDDLITEFIQTKNLEINYPILYKFYIPSEDCHTLYEYLLAYNSAADNLFPGLHGIYKRMEDDIHFEKTRVNM